MQAYGAAFARIYDQRWAGFARQLAPLVREYYEKTPLGQENRSLLDLCCGTGQLALHFLEHGYRVTGVDLSEPMLNYARRNVALYIERNQAVFIQAAASRFNLEQPVGLAVSTYDALNHLENLAALGSCFRSVITALLEGGTFVFDLNTRYGLVSHWNSINVEDSQELTIINRAIYDGTGDRAVTRITGYARTQDGLYERFEETVYNTVFDLEAVREALLEAGFREAYFARGQALADPIDHPENERRVFLIATR